MNRRDFLSRAGGTLAALACPLLWMNRRRAEPSPEAPGITLFLCGDVMTGRGVDQILAQPSDPRLFESYVRNALRYVELAEALNGPIPRGVDSAYIWGDALQELERAAPDVRVINLETAVTTSDDPWPRKGINYRMHPDNIDCLTTAGIDCCVLANNHVLDWGHAGLLQTLETLDRAGLSRAGAGRDQQEAMAPAILEVSGRGRVLVFAFGSTSSGIPAEWAATVRRPGVNLLRSLEESTVAEISAQVAAVKRPGDLAVASIHWGSNWGHTIPMAHRDFAHRLIDEAGIDVIHGHSSHHPRAIEVYGDRLILYGCGDFLNDYEGIRGYEEFRGDLSLMFFPHLEPVTQRLGGLSMSPLQIRRFQLRRASPADARWLQQTLTRVSRPLGAQVEHRPDSRLALRWHEARGPA